jgi:5-formyltetrahydrofolate cyclo-ligase
VDVPAWRRQQRIQLIDRRTRLSAEEHRRASAHIVTLLEQELSHFEPGILSSYWPFKGEVDLRDLMHKLRGKGWTTALPVVAGRGKPLQFRHWTSTSEMETGVHQIPVPADGEPVVPQIVVTPLVGFDSSNYRLGYGAGYFDITLASMTPRPLAIGVGFETSRLATIYPSSADIPMDLVITENGIQRRDSGAIS